MPKSLAKVTKHIKGKKGRITALHEHSRDARRLQRASGRDDKLAHKVWAREKANAPHVHRVAFFQSCVPANATPYEVTDIQSLITLFLGRHNEDLATLQSERRAGRPPSTQEVKLKQEKERDEKEYDSGLWVPDLRDEETLFSLREWKGEWSALSMLQFVRINRAGVLKESSFPPKGQS